MKMLIVGTFESVQRPQIPGLPVTDFLNLFQIGSLTWTGNWQIECSPEIVHWQTTIIHEHSKDCWALVALLLPSDRRAAVGTHERPPTKRVEKKTHTHARTHTYADYSRTICANVRSITASELAGVANGRNLSFLGRAGSSARVRQRIIWCKLSHNSRLSTRVCVCVCR